MNMALNLCEIPLHKLREDFLNKIFMQVQPERIYIGSNFCSQYFLNFGGIQSVLKYCEEKHIPITLTVPVVSEKDLTATKEKIKLLLSKNEADCIIDEITVNDIGMLQYAKEFKIKINCGRLMFKTPRDARISDINSVPILKTFTCHDIKISAIEIDPVRNPIEIGLSDEVKIYLHVPYCYATVGNICEFASIHRPLNEKFRPNAKCRMECSENYQIYRSRNNEEKISTEYFRFGRTLYYNHENVKISSNVERIIYFPLNEVIGCLTEEYG